MKLTLLKAYFTKYSKKAVDPTVWIDGVLHTDGFCESYAKVETLAEADGIWFHCPQCFGREHPHRVMVGFADRCPPGSYTQGSRGEDTRWTVDPRSTGLNDLILTPSIQLTAGCRWHGFVGSSGVPPGEAA